MSPSKQDMRTIVRDGYEAGDYAGAFRSNFDPDTLERHFLQKLLSLVPENPEIVDLGCGPGVPFDRFLVSRGARITGVDFCTKHIALAKRNVPSGTFVEADFSKLDLESNSFDAALSLYAIFHLPRDEHEAVIAKLARVLKPNGLLLANFSAAAFDYGEDANWTGARMAWSSHAPETYRRLLSEAGFEIVESRFEGAPGDQEYHWWVLARKIA
jgi:ubiquinone/menaquinone biosynthesis C-methylase UbiE